MAEAVDQPRRTDDFAHQPVQQTLATFGVEADRGLGTTDVWL